MKTRPRADARGWQVLLDLGSLGFGSLPRDRTRGLRELLPERSSGVLPLVPGPDRRRGSRPRLPVRSRRRVDLADHGCPGGGRVLRIGRLRLDVETARYGVLLLVFCPMAFFFQAVYSESLFLLLAATAFLLAEHRRFAWAARRRRLPAHAAGGDRRRRRDLAAGLRRAAQRPFASQHGPGPGVGRRISDLARARDRRTVLVSPRRKRMGAPLAPRGL